VPAESTDQPTFGGFGVGGSFAARSGPIGEFGIHIVNQLPVLATDLQVVIGTVSTRPATQNDSDWTKVYRQSLLGGLNRNPGKTIAVEQYQFIPIRRNLKPQEQLNKTVPAQLMEFTELWQRQSAWYQQTAPQRTLHHVGESVAWLTGRMAVAATLKVNEECSNYVPDDESRHYFIQRILPEDMPDLTSLLDDQPTEQRD